MFKKKKLKEKDINKNNFTEKKHTINKIKKQETKYTVFLVIFFMVLFSIIGYNILVFNDKDLENIVLEKDETLENLTFTSPSITLNENDILDDDKGLEKKPYRLRIENNKSTKVKYTVFLEEDKFAQKTCGCNNNNNYLLKYSLDKKNISIFNNDTPIIREIREKSKEEILITLWLDKNSSLTENFHFHGHFVLKEIKG